MSPLSELPVHTTALVIAIATDEATVHRLGVLGLLPGQAITVVKNRGSAPLVVEVGAAHFALGREIAREISVDWEQTP